MALLNPTFLFGIVVLIYLSSFIFFAIIRILTGVSIQRIGYFSLRRLAYTPRDGLKIEIRGLGLHVHRPTFAQPTWLSIVVDELMVTVDITELDGNKADKDGVKDGDEEGDPLLEGHAKEEKEKTDDAGEKTDNAPKTPPIPSIRREHVGAPRSETWKHLTNAKNRIKRLHRKLNWLRMVDVVATNSTISVVDVGNIQFGSLTVAVDTRRKMVDRARFFFQGRADKKRPEKRQAEWIMTLRSVLFTADGHESLEVLDSASLNIHGFLYEAMDGLRDAAIALKLGRAHIPYDEMIHSVHRYKKIKAQMKQPIPEGEDLTVTVDKVMQEIEEPGSTDHDLMQTVSDSKEFVSSMLRGIKEVQFAVSFFGVTKRVEAVKKSGLPVVLNASMKEVGIDLHRLDPKSPAHRMYFPSKDIAHEALAAALSISIGLDDGHGKPERLMYIPMATTTVRTTLPSKTVELTEDITYEERNANILFANMVVTSPSIDLDPRHLPLLLAILQPKPKPPREGKQRRHMLISRLLPKANIKFSMHEPVLRIALPTVEKTADPDDFDLIISSISSVSIDLESFHSAVEELHYSLASTMRVQTHNLYYQTSSGSRFDLLTTEAFDLKVNLNASPDVHVVATGNLDTFALKMVRPEINDGLRQIVRQLRLNVEPDKRAVSKTAKHSNFLRAMPTWLLHFQLQASDFSVEVAGVDEEISEDTRGVAVQLESWSAEYRAQKVDGLQRRPTSRRRATSRSALTPDTDLLMAVPMSPRKRHQNPGDGRRVAIHVRGLEAFVVESAETWEIEPFVKVPRFEVAFSTLSDNQGPVFHIQSHIRTLLVQYSLYRHYAVGVATLILRKAFMRTNREAFEARVVPPQTPTMKSTMDFNYLTPPRNVAADGSLNDSEPAAVVKELVSVDFKAAIVQIKADMPADPPIMLQAYGMEVGRHRWSPPFVNFKLIRLYAEAPRMRKVWARMISVKNGRMDYRKHQRKPSGKPAEEQRMFDFQADAIRLAVPHEMVVNKISDNLVNVVKSVAQLHHRFKTGTNEYILQKAPEGPKNVPKISLRTRTLLFELEDGAFEWKLGMIYRAGRIEQMQRQARDEAFRLKVKKIQEDEAKREHSKFRARSTAPRGRSTASHNIFKRSHSADGRTRRSHDDHRGRAPRYDPDAGCSGLSSSSHVSIAEARHKLDVHNAQSWKKRIDRFYAMATEGMKELRSLFWGKDDLPDELEDSERILEIPHRPALMAALITDLHVNIDKPTFPMKELPDFLHKVGKGMPRDMVYSLLVPMHVQIDMGEAKLSLRDYPLPLLHVPALKAGQSLRLPALSMKTNFVIAEEFRGAEATRRIKVNIIPPKITETGTKSGGFAIDVRRTIGPVKSYSDMSIDINTAQPTRITWGPSYQPAIQDMMMAIESFTKPQLDPSDRVGFWDKIRLNFHTRVRVAWRGDGDVHFALKGTRDPYQVTGNGAGFLMCWRNDVRWNLHADDDPKRFMTVDSGEYVLAIPDYSHQVREERRRQGEDDSVGSEDSYKSGAAFKKVVMKLSGRVQWLAGLVFEKAIVDGKRSFDFKPHYDVVLKSPQHAKSQDGLPYDAFRGFRSQHIHLSIAIRAPVDREWTSPNPEPSRSYNTIHLTPRFFTHFFAWWSLFSGPMSLPIRQGKIWPGREKNSKKFGRHLATIKYNLLLSPLFLSHIYKHKELEDYAENAVSATGIKVRFDSFMLDLHQRREEFNTRDRGRKNSSRTTSMKLHAAQLDLVSADIRAVSASIRGTTAEAIKKNSVSAFVQHQDDDGTDLSRFTIPDNDFSWIDMDDFVELDWILPTEPNPDTKILPLVYAPRITYFRQTDIGGIISGDPHRSSPFGDEPTHLCIMSQDDDPRRVQAEFIRQRLEQLNKQMEAHGRNVGEAELRVIRDEKKEPSVRGDYEALCRHTTVLEGKKEFLENMLRQMTSTSAPESSVQSQHTATGSQHSAHSSSGSSSATGSLPPNGTEFASDFSNRFVVHNMQLKWNNTLRNIILRYIHQVSQRRGFIYYLSRPAVKFILDIVDEQAKSKTARNNTQAPQTGAAPTPDPNSPENKTGGIDIEDTIRKILQDGRKFVNADDSGDNVPVMSMDDITSGIADEYTPQNNYHVRLIAPQIQLQSDKNKKHVVLVTAKGMELKVVEVMDKARLSDNVSGLVQRRFLVNMDSTQFFVTHQKWFQTQLVSMYSGSNYGTPAGSASWPPWVPMEVMFDFQADPFGFKRVVQKTSAMLRYDKYNTLRLKYHDDVNTGDDDEGTQLDNLWVEFPQARALCNSSQYYAIYVIVLDLLMYNEPLEQTRSEKLEKIMLASDFSDLRGAPEMVVRLQERVRQLEDIKTHFQVHSKYLDTKGWQDRLLLERDLAACEDELFFVMKAITTSQRKYETGSNALLKWSISAKDIVWHLVRDTNEPLVELQLKDVEYDRTDNSDGSHINVFQVGKILGLNLLQDAIYPVMVAPYLESEKGMADLNTQPMIRVYWYMLEAIGGIPVMGHFEVNLFPMKIQLEREVGKKLFEYIFPGIEGDPTAPNDSPFMIKQHIPADDDTEEDSLAGSTDRLHPNDRLNDSTFSTRPGSLELRLRPTLTSEPKLGATIKQKAQSLHNVEASTFRFFRSGTGSKTIGSIVRRQPSHESLGSSTPKQLGVTRTGTGFSSIASRDTSASNEKKSRFGALRGKKDTSSEDKKSKQQQDDDLTKMMDRASNYMTFAYIKMPSVVLCLSYKGKGDRNIEDVHDFVFRLPTIEWRNKTWSNLDLALALKSRVIKALISHTGAIIGNKFSRHRPTTAQQSKLRELATSSVLLATPQLSSSQFSVDYPPSSSNTNSGDDSSSVVDFSRSPPRSIASRSQSSLPVRTTSRSSSAASSGQSSSIYQTPGGNGNNINLNPPNYPANSPKPTQGGNVSVSNNASGAIPSFLMMTPPTPQDSFSSAHSSGARSFVPDLLRPGSSSGGGRLFGSRNSSGESTGIPRPGSSHSGRSVHGSSGGGGGGPGFRGKLSALAGKLRDKAASDPVLEERSEEGEETDEGRQGGQGGGKEQQGNGTVGGNGSGTGTGTGLLGRRLSRRNGSSLRG